MNDLSCQEILFKIIKKKGLFLEVGLFLENACHSC